MSKYAFNTETLYEKTDNGLNIIKHYLGNCKDFDLALQNPKNAFIMRDNDITNSSTLIPNNKVIKSKSVNYWRVKDFGEKFYTPIQLAQEHSGLDFYNCLKMCYELFNLTEGNTFFKADVEIKVLDDTDKRPLDWFNVVTKKHTQLDIIGTYVTEKIAGNYDFEAVEYYEKIFFNKKTSLKTYIKVIATDSFPIFAYMPDKTWCKTYAPFSKDKSYKHGYLGKKPERHVFGLAQIEKKYNNVIAELDKRIKKSKDEFEIIRLSDEKENFKLPAVIVASGGTDGLNVASLDYDVIWYNSESEQLNFAEYEKLNKICKAIYNLPDVDGPGIKYGHEVAENFWNLKSIWLPKSKLGNSGKDFRDWLKFYKQVDLKTVQFQFKNLMTGALKCKFFERSVKSKRFSIKTSYLHYFLKINGFFLYYPEKKYTEKTGVQEFIFIKIDNHIVTQYFPNDIRKFCETYLIEKGQQIEVIDLVKNTDQFNEAKLMSMDKIVLDFKNYTEDTQTFFYKNNFATISGDKIEFQPYKELKNYVWDYKIINRNLFIEKPFFHHYLDENKKDRVEILQHDCDYMNYLINGSRMFWRKELEEPFGDDLAAKEKYHSENKFSLSGAVLTNEERLIQDKHFLNKSWSIGYLLHRYKIESLAKLVYVMDDNTKESEDDSNGRSGKSVFFVGIDKILNNYFYINGKSKNITTNSHLLDGFTKENDYIKIEDVDQYLGVEFFYNWVTGAIAVNPKTKKPYNVDFADAGKMAVTSNFGLGKINQSTMGRIHFVSFSDYYHVHTEKYLEERKISKDFNNKDLFSSAWNDKQWNLFFNYLMQCCQLYLNNRDSEITAPQNNIHLTNVQAEMGQTFINWANGYFQDDFYDEESFETLKGTLNHYISRDEVFKSYNVSAGVKFAKTSTNFKKSLKLYCENEIKDNKGNIIKPKWIFNPSDCKGYDKKTKNILKRSGDKVLEHFFIRTPDVEVQPYEIATKLQDSSKPIAIEQKKDFINPDLPF